MLSFVRKLLTSPKKVLSIRSPNNKVKKHWILSYVTAITRRWKTKSVVGGNNGRIQGI